MLPVKPGDNMVAMLPMGHVFGMTYDFLPFMILPLYTTLSKLDDSYLEAAADLGANAALTFLKVTLPLSVPGLISGVTMVFLPSMTNYVILDMLYNSTYIMGSLIGSYFNAYDWHSGSMISIVLLVIIFILTWVALERKRRTGGQSYDEKGITFFLAGNRVIVYVPSGIDPDGIQFYRYGNDWNGRTFLTEKLRDVVYK